MLFLFRAAQAILGLEEPLGPKGTRWGFGQVVAFSHNFLPFTLFYFLLFSFSFQGTKRSNGHDRTARQSWKESKYFVSFCSLYPKLPNTTFIMLFMILCSCGTTVRSRKRKQSYCKCCVETLPSEVKPLKYFQPYWDLESALSPVQHENLVLWNELIKIELPYWKFSKADF